MEILVGRKYPPPTRSKAIVEVGGVVIAIVLIRTFRYTEPKLRDVDVVNAGGHPRSDWSHNGSPIFDSLGSGAGRLVSSRLVKQETHVMLTNSKQDLTDWRKIDQNVDVAELPEFSVIAVVSGRTQTTSKYAQCRYS